MEAAKLAATVTFSDKLKKEHGFSFWNKIEGAEEKGSEGEEERRTSDDE